MGQKSENFCGATQIDENIVRSATCQHTSFPGNGGKARRLLLKAAALFRPPSAVHSAKSFLPPSHHRRLAGRTLFAYSSASLVCLFSKSLTYESVLCQEPLLNFHRMTKKGEKISQKILKRKRNQADPADACAAGNFPPYSGSIIAPHRAAGRIRRNTAPEVPPGARCRGSAVRWTGRRYRL